VQPDWPEGKARFWQLSRWRLLPGTLTAALRWWRMANPPGGGCGLSTELLSLAFHGFVTTAVDLSAVLEAVVD
jgi:hypothetical protein